MRLAIIFLISVFSAGAQAQAMYRSVMPDGKIVFGDKPAPGAKESKALTVRPTNQSTAEPGSSPKAAGKPSHQQMMEAATGDIKAAQDNLKRARATLQSNRDPTPDEMVGTVKSGKGGTGGMRTTESYDQRIKALEQDVETAQRQLDEAQTRRNELR